MKKKEAKVRGCRNSRLRDKTSHTGEILDVSPCTLVSGTTSGAILISHPPSHLGDYAELESLLLGCHRCHNFH